MRRFRIPTRAPIGVDIGGRCIKAAQLGGGVLAAASVPRTASNGAVEAAEVRRLHEAIRQDPFRGNTVVLAVPAAKLMTGIMELPPRSSGAPIEQLARSELARRHNVEPKSLEMACWDLPTPARAANRTYVMAVAGSLADLDQLVEAFEAEGLNVRALDIHAAAVSRACRKLVADTSGTAAVLDVGWTSSQLVLLYQGVTVYERNLTKCGIGALVRLLAGQMDAHESIAERLLCEDGLKCLSPADAGTQGTAALLDSPGAYLETMLSEMRIPLSYLVSQYPDAQFQKLLLIGGGARIPGLQAFLASRLELEVQVVRPTDLCPCPESVDAGYGSALVPAIGLAQYGEG